MDPEPETSGSWEGSGPCAGGRKRNGRSLLEIHQSLYAWWLQELRADGYILQSRRRADPVGCRRAALDF